MGWPKGRPKSEEHKRKISAANKAPSEDKIRKLSEAHKGKTRTEDHRRRTSEALHRRWNDPEERLKMLEGKARHLRANLSPYESYMANLLTDLGIEFENNKVMGVRYIVDFFIPLWEMVVEIDGNHHRWVEGKPERDAERDKWLYDQGYTVVRFCTTEMSDVIGEHATKGWVL